MNLFAKFMIAALFIAMMLPFTVLKGPDGDTLMSFSNLELPNFSLPDLPDAGKISSPLDGNVGKDIVYKWQDAEGNLQFTTELPPEGIEYSVMEFNPDTNVIQAVELPAEEEEQGEVAEADSKETEEGANPYSPEKIEKLFEDAKNVENLLKQRFKDQEEALNQ